MIDDVAKRTAGRLRQVSDLNAQVYSDLAELLADRSRLIARIAELEIQIAKMQGATTTPATQEPSDREGRRLLTVAEVRKMLSIGATRAWALVSEGKLEKVKIGRSTRVPSHSVEAYLASLRSDR